MKNWKTTVTGIGGALFSVLLVLSILPATLGDLAAIIPPEWKVRLATTALVATTILRILNALAQNDAKGGVDPAVKARLGLLLVAFSATPFLTGCASDGKPLIPWRGTVTWSGIGISADSKDGIVAAVDMDQVLAARKVDQTSGK